MNKNNIAFVFASFRFPPPMNIGGDGFTTQQMGKVIRASGIKTCFLGCSDTPLYPPNQNFTRDQLIEKLNKLSIGFEENAGSLIYDLEATETIVVNQNSFFQSLDRLMSNLKNNGILPIIITQLEGSPEIVSRYSKQSCLLFPFVIDNEPHNIKLFDSLDASNPKNCFLIFNSNFTAKYYKDRIGKLNYHVLYPVVDENKYLPNGKILREDSKFITMVNPIEKKGFEIFKNLSSIFPSLEFRAVEGWYPIKDKRQIESKYPNIRILPKTDAILDFYQTSMLHLVPSQWEETFGRVCVEASLSGIHVIASKVGGIPEALGPFGHFVDDYKSTEAWAEAINAFLVNPAKFKGVKQKVLNHVKQFFLTAICNNFLSYVEAKIR